MKTANQTRNQIAATILSFAALVGIAGVAPSGSVTSEPQSFIGTVPNASAVEAQAPTF